MRSALLGEHFAGGSSRVALRKVEWILGDRDLSAAGTRKKVGAQAAGRSGARRKPRRLSLKTRIAVAVAAVMVGLVAWATIARALAPTENTTQEHFDTLIVLGYPADSDGNPTPPELERVTEAVRAGRHLAVDRQYGLLRAEVVILPLVGFADVRESVEDLSGVGFPDAV